MNQKHQRVGVFVDVQNMYYSARALFDQRVDFGEILKNAVGDRQLIRSFAYVIKADKEDEQSFFDALEERGYELRSKELLQFYGGNQKGDWDVGLSMDVVRLAPKLDVVILVSGDGDFADLLRYVKSQGCRTEVMAFGSSTSSSLREETDVFVDMSNDKRKYLIPKKRNTRSKTKKTAKSTPKSAAPKTQQAPAQRPKATTRAATPRKPIPRQPSTQRTTAPRPAAPRRTAGARTTAPRTPKPPTRTSARSTKPPRITI